METAEVLWLLNDLIHLDIDAVQVYEQAIGHVLEDEIRDNLIDFQNDHRGHAELLSKQMGEYGAVPPDFAPNFKGAVMEGVTALLGITGPEGLLSAMEANERLMNWRYREADALDLPPDMKYLVKSSLADEARHLAYFQELLKRKRHRP